MKKLNVSCVKYAISPGKSKVVQKYEHIIYRYIYKNFNEVYSLVKIKLLGSPVTHKRSSDCRSMELDLI